MRSLRVGDRVRGKVPFSPTVSRELTGTVVEVARPTCLPGTWLANTVVAWDDPTYGESFYAGEWMVVLLPEDYGAGPT